MLTILLVDDEKASRLRLKSQLKSFHLLEASTLDEALALIEKKPIDIAFIDLNLDPTTAELMGFMVLKSAVEKGIYCVVMSSLGTEEVIEQAYELGCHNFYVKGDEKQNILSIVNSYLLEKNDFTQSHFLNEVLKTKSVEQQKEVSKIIPFIETDIPINLHGESGTGKTYLAQMIHRLSKRTGEFVQINCAALSDELLEAELFGYKKGAFTGATEDRRGKMQLAHQGTLFLDELGSMSLLMQAKLLKAIEEKSFYPVNSDKFAHSDFRVISATLDNLEEKIKKGEFRFDLYQRICGTSLTLLPLRKRTEDILELLRIEMESNHLNGRRIVLTKDARSSLSAYSFPGNIRELKRIAQKISNANLGLISKEVVESFFQNNFNQQVTGNLVNDNMVKMAQDLGLMEFIELIEKEIVTAIYKKNNNAVRKTLGELKISQSKLYKYVSSKKPFEVETSL